MIGHPRDRAPITWQMVARRTNHDREFCYRYDYYNNIIIIIIIIIICVICVILKTNIVKKYYECVISFIEI